MSASSTPKNVSLADWNIEDPGDGAALPNEVSGMLGVTVGSGVETNTIADPVRAGQQLTIYGRVDGGGSRAITFATAPSVDTTKTLMTIGNAGAFIVLQSMEVEIGNFEWRLVASMDVAQAGLYAVGIDMQGKIDGIILDTNADTTISAPTDDQIDFEIGGADVVVMYATGMQDHGTEAVTATVGGGTTGLISQGSKHVTATSDTATKQISLPAATVGDILFIHVLGAACELISVVAAHTVNDVAVGATNELALVQDSLYRCHYVETNGWIVTGVTKLGADEAALVPDAL